MAVLLGAILSVSCLAGADRPAADDVEDQIIDEPPPPSQGDLSTRLYLLNANQVTASTFAEGTTITAVYEITNRGDTADCMKSSSGPIVSFHLYEGKTEIASSTEGMKFLTVMSPFTIAQGIYLYPSMLQNLRVSTDEALGTIAVGTYSVVAQKHFGCGQDGLEVESEYAFAVTN